MSLYERYELLEEIGHGNFCTVRRAIRKDTGQVFAAKYYKNEFISAKNQMQLLVRLDHPNIVNIYEVFEVDNEEEMAIILILQFMEGGQLYSSIGQRTYFTESQVKTYMRILVDTIRYCHQMNVVHRDIKPQNLLLTTNSKEGILKLADFGISKILSDEMLTTNCGTPIYMAPEIWEGNAYNEKVDIWSMGVVMYFLLSGKHPFDGDLDVIGDLVTQGDLSFQHNSWNLVSSKAIDLIRKMLQKNPDERPSAVELAKHIWFSEMSIQSNKSNSYEITEISLHRTVNKIRRNIFKNKEKRLRHKLKRLSEAERLPRQRFTFLTHVQTEESFFTESDFEGEENPVMDVQ